MEVRPVPPPATVRMPEVVAERVKEPFTLVRYMPVVRPFTVALVEVPKVMFPVWALPYVWAIVTEVVADWRQVPEMEKQPPERLRPFAKVEEAVVEVVFRMEAERPAAKVEVAVVEVAVR